MSKAIKKQLDDRPDEDKALEKTYTIYSHEFQFLRNLDIIMRAYTANMQQLNDDYLRGIAARLGHEGEDLRFAIDLNDEKRELTLKRVYIPKTEKPASPLDK